MSDRERYEGNLYRFKIRLFQREAKAKKLRADTSDTLYRLGDNYSEVTSREISWRRSGRLFLVEGRYGMGYVIINFAPWKFRVMLRHNEIALASTLAEAKLKAEIHCAQNSDTPGFDAYRL